MNYSECGSCLRGNHDKCERGWVEGQSIEFACDCENCYPEDQPSKQSTLSYFQDRWIKRQ